MPPVPEVRIARCNTMPLNVNGDFVLYWMVAFRRTGWNFSLQRAVEWCVELKKPLLVFEPLRAGYGWASDRFHRFIIDGMAANSERLKKSKAAYYPYVEPTADAGKGLLAALAQRACLVVTDDYPAFFIPSMISAASGSLPLLIEKVDGNGLLPMSVADSVFTGAQFFRRFLQKELAPHLASMPEPDPLKQKMLPDPIMIPKAVLKKWPPVSPELLRGGPKTLSALPINHQVSPVERTGGSKEGLKTLKGFIESKLAVYPENRNHPDDDATSGLSPYLHFGHISVHEIFRHLADKEGWTPQHLSKKVTGGRAGWWRMSEAAEAFLDELVTWREIGFNMCRRNGDYARYDSLPDWALKTLNQHSKDKRRYLYSLEAFETATTHDPLWNAAQTQLLLEGRIHNYMRMVWGKKILEWTPSPRQALDVMIELNNKYALDGRDPNSYTGIFWCLGRYDRAWGPERPIFGKIRYMSSENTIRKLRIDEYLEKYRPSIHS
ncbi:MAG: deoxyribodipyrimidine photolyase [Deltaproteobacteria bacterium]|nr:deoxyribodipyrimidine photolyase [Deltaproteobacteria bacterium]